MRRNNIEVTYWYFDDSCWSESPHKAVRRLAREKVYSYSDFSENILQEPDGSSGWKPVSKEVYEGLSGFEQGQLYVATPYENESHERCWTVSSIRVGDHCLVDFGIPEKVALKTDFVIKMSDSLFRLFEKRVTSISGVVEDKTVDFAALQVAASDAEGLRQELERLLDQAQQLSTTADPNGNTVRQLEYWRDEAVNLRARYQQARLSIKQSVDQLLQDKGRSDEKAQAHALFLSLPESAAVIGIDALLAEAIRSRAQALDAGTAGVKDPKMALLHTVLQGIYGNNINLTVTFDDRETITIKHTSYSHMLTFIPSGIK